MKAVVLDGIVLGLAFGLLGVGMTLVYGLGGVLNLAYGQIVVLGAIVVMLMMEDDVATFLAAVVGVLAAAGVAVLLDLTLMRAVYRQHGEERTLLGLLLTLGVAFVIGGLLTWRYPTGALYIYISGEPVSIFGVPMAVGSIWASVIALAVAAALLLLRPHDLRARRSVGDPGRDRGAPRRHQPVVRPHGRLRAERRARRDRGDHAVDERAAGGQQRVPADHLRSHRHRRGRPRQRRGAFFAGLLLGVVNTLSAHYIGQYITTIILLGAAALTILIRPRGLLGR